MASLYDLATLGPTEVARRRHAARIAKGLRTRQAKREARARMRKPRRWKPGDPLPEWIRKEFGIAAEAAEAIEAGPTLADAGEAVADPANHGGSRRSGEGGVSDGQ